MARIPYVEPENAEGQAAELFEHVQRWVQRMKDNPGVKMPKGGNIPNNWKMWANNPKLGLLAHELADYFMNESPLDHRLRELMILLMTTRWPTLECHMTHIGICGPMGVALDVARNIRYYETSTVFSERDRILLRYADQMILRGGHVETKCFSSARGFSGKRCCSSIRAASPSGCRWLRTSARSSSMWMGG